MSLYEDGRLTLEQHLLVMALCDRFKSLSPDRALELYKQHLTASIQEINRLRIDLDKARVVKYSSELNVYD